MQERLKQYEKILERVLIKFGIDIIDEENALEVIEAIKENRLSISMINVYPEILSVKSSKVHNIINEFEKVGLPLSILEKSPIVIEKTNAARISKMQGVLEEYKFTNKLVEKYPEILAIGKDSNVKEIIDIFEENGIDKKYFYGAGDVLAYGYGKDIKSIIPMLDKYGFLKNVLKKCPKVFYSNPSEVIEEIIKLYKDPKVGLGLSLLRNNVEILAETTKVRIQAIINMLNRNGITEKVLVKEPSIVYKNDTKVLETYIMELKSRRIDKNLILSIAEVLTYSDLEFTRLLNKMDYILAYYMYFGSILETNPKLALDSNIKDIREFIEYIEKGKIDKNIFKINPNAILNSSDNILKIINNLKEIKNDMYFVRHPKILELKEPDNILKVYKVITENNIEETVLEDEDLFIYSDLNKLNSIINRLDVNVKNSKDIENVKEIKVDIEEVKEITDEEMIEDDQIENISEGEMENMEEIKDYLIEKNIIVDEEDIPSVIYSKGKLENIKEIVKYLEELGLINELKNAMSLLIRPSSNIKENVDIFAENQMSDMLITNISLLSLSSQTLGRRIRYLKSQNLNITPQILKLSNGKFEEEFGVEEENILSLLEDQYLAQELIDSVYSEYLNSEESELTEKEEVVFNEIYEEIQELGVLENNIEYVKAGYSFSNEKIKKNLNKIISNISKIQDISNIEDGDKVYIRALSVIGNKILTEEEATEVCLSIIKNIKESESNPKYIKPAISLEIKEEIKDKEKVEDLEVENTEEQKEQENSKEELEKNLDIELKEKDEAVETIETDSELNGNDTELDLKEELVKENSEDKEEIDQIEEDLELEAEVEDENEEDLENSEEVLNEETIFELDQRTDIIDRESINRLINSTKSIKDLAIAKKHEEKDIEEMEENLLNNENEIEEEKEVEISDEDLKDLGIDDEEIARLEEEIRELELKNKDLSNIYGLEKEEMLSDDEENSINNELEKNDQKENNNDTAENVSLNTNNLLNNEPKEEVGKIVIDKTVLNEYNEAIAKENTILNSENSGLANKEVHYVEKKILNDNEIREMKEKLELMSKTFKNFSKELDEREFEEEARKAREEKDKISKILQRRQEKELLELRKKTEMLEEKRRLEEEARRVREEKARISEMLQKKQEKELLELKKKNELLEEKRRLESERAKLEEERKKVEENKRKIEENKRKAEEEKAIQEKIRIEAERIANEKLAKIKKEQEIENKIKEEAQKLIDEELKKKEAERKAKEEAEKIAKAKEEEKRRLEEEARRVREEEAKKLEELNKAKLNESINLTVTPSNSNVSNNINNINNRNSTITKIAMTPIDDLEEYEEIEDNIDSYYLNANNHQSYNKPKMDLSNMHQNIQNFNANQVQTKQMIQAEFARNDVMREARNNQGYDMQNQMGFGYENSEKMYNPNNMSNSNFNSNIGTDEFNRTIDAYYNPNQKAFFSIEDYGYILNEVDEQELKRMQVEMNEIYKREKNNNYYE